MFFSIGRKEPYLDFNDFKDSYLFSPSFCVANVQTKEIPEKSNIEKKKKKKTWLF